MSGPATTPPAAVMIGAPDAVTAALRQPGLVAITLSDRAAAQPAALEMLALYAAAFEMREIGFWGRGAPYHEDRLRDLLSGYGRPAPTIWSSRVFEPIDFLNAAARIVDAAAFGASLALLDDGDPLDAALKADILKETKIAPVVLGGG